jgi:hypothetical protein
MASNNTRGMGHGFITFTVTSDEFKAQTDFSGSFSDLFRIVKPGALAAFLLFVEDNPILVSLFLAPIFAGIVVVSLNRWKGWPPLSKHHG